MKKLFVPLLLIAFLAASCSKEDEPVDRSEEKNIEVESFIFRAMEDWYLYEAEIPQFESGYFSDYEAKKNYLASFETPESLFEALQASHDRFSFMWDDYEELEKLLYSGIDKSTGMIYGLGRIGDSDNVFGIVYYVLPGTSAEQEGVLRGDAFQEINGTKLTVDNYKSLLGEDSFTLTIAEINNNTITNTDRTANLVQSEIAENPVYMTSIIEQDGQRIGYLLYNGFTMDFDPQLNDAFAYFKSEGINHLIVDLRYNSGGSIETAVDLAAMITGQYEEKVFAQTMLNEKWQQIYETQAPEQLKYRFNAKISNDESINSLMLNKVYVIATKKSASASELLINGLRPYVTVVQVGESTAGKFQGSRTLYDSTDEFFQKKNVNPNHTYALQPLITKVANSQGTTDYRDGLAPDISASENINDYGPLGDPSEVLLQAAINDILGLPQQEVSAEAKAAESKFKVFGGSDMGHPTYQRMYLQSRPINSK